MYLFSNKPMNVCNTKAIPYFVAIGKTNPSINVLEKICACAKRVFCSNFNLLPPLLVHCLDTVAVHVPWP